MCVCVIFFSIRVTRFHYGAFLTMTLSGTNTNVEDTLLLCIAIFKDTKVEMLMLSSIVLIKAIGNGLSRPVSKFLNAEDF